jgi:methylglyoxal synthase
LTKFILPKKQCQYLFSPNCSGFSPILCWIKESRPLGGDQQIGAKIADGEIDFLIFFWDPLEPVPHDPDVEALLRMAMVWNIPIACNRSSADFMISSHLMDEAYDRLVPDYDDYQARKITRGE